MNCYQIQIELFLKFQIDHKRSLEPLSKLLSSCLYKISLKTLHEEKGFKYYTFSNLLKISKSGVYQKGENGFIFRTADEKTAMELMRVLFEYEDEYFKVKEISLKKISQKPIKSILSVNPVIISYTPKNSKARQWTFESERGVEYLLEQLHKNLAKKYESFYQEKIPKNRNFIEMIQLKNQKPLSIYYHKDSKEFRLFGNKFYIVPKDDTISQKLAFMALSSGLGEKNALGGGFCRGYFDG